MPDPDAATTAAELLCDIRHAVALKFGVITDYDTEVIDITLRVARPVIEAEARASEHQRIRTAVFDNPADLIGPRRHREAMMNWRQRALHAALEDDNAR